MGGMVFWRGDLLCQIRLEGKAKHRKYKEYWELKMDNYLP
jgi:hypothetical protein